MFRKIAAALLLSVVFVGTASAGYHNYYAHPA